MDGGSLDDLMKDFKNGIPKSKIKIILK